MNRVLTEGFLEGCMPGTMLKACKDCEWFSKWFVPSREEPEDHPEHSRFSWLSETTFPFWRNLAIAQKHINKE